MPRSAKMSAGNFRGSPKFCKSCEFCRFDFLQKFLAEQADVSQIAPSRNSADMKAKIIVTPKKAVVDPQGKTVQGALEHMGYQGIGAVHVGKYLEIELSGTDKEAARKQIDDACHKILSNPVIEDYRFEIE